jgi:hypothetical protein
MQRFTISLQVRPDGVIRDDGPSLEYTFVAAPLATNMENIIQSFTRSGSSLEEQSPGDLCLQGKIGAQILDMNKPLQTQLSSYETNVLYLLPKPTLRVERILKRIVEEDQARLKDLLFHLRVQLQASDTLYQCQPTSNHL